MKHLHHFCNHSLIAVHLYTIKRWSFMSHANIFLYCLYVTLYFISDPYDVTVDDSITFYDEDWQKITEWTVRVWSHRKITFLIHVPLEDWKYWSPIYRLLSLVYPITSKKPLFFLICCFTTSSTTLKLRRKCTIIRCNYIFPQNYRPLYNDLRSVLGHPEENKTGKEYPVLTSV